LAVKIQVKVIWVVTVLWHETKVSDDLAASIFRVHPTWRHNSEDLLTHSRSFLTSSFILVHIMEGITQILAKYLK